MADPGTAPPAAPPALLTPKAAAAYLSLGRNTLDKWAALGLVPAPAKVGGKVLYSREMLDLWTRHGCPDAAAFAAVWAAHVAAVNPAPAPRRSTTPR